MKTHRSQSGTTLALVVFVIVCIALVALVVFELISAIYNIVPQPPPANGTNEIVWTFPNRTGPAWMVADKAWTVYSSTNLTAWTQAGTAYGSSNSVQSALRSMVGREPCRFWKAIPLN